MKRLNVGQMIPFRSFSILWKELGRRRQLQLVALQVLSLAAGAGEVLNLGALLPFLRILSNPKQGLNSLGPLSKILEGLPTQQLLLILGAIFLSAVVVSTALRILVLVAQQRLTALIGADLGTRVFQQSLWRPYPWHLETNTSKVLTHLTTDVDQTVSSIQQLLLISSNGIIVVLLGGSLLALAPQIMVFVLVLISIFYVVVFQFTRKTLKLDGQERRENLQKALQTAQEGLGGIRDVILDRSQRFFEQRYQQASKRQRLAVARISIKAGSPRYLIEGFSVVIIVVISIFLALNGQGIERQLPLLGTITLGAYRILQPIQQCFTGWSSLQSNRASFERIAPFLENYKTTEIIYHESAIDHVTKPFTIEFDNVSFRYRDDSPIVLKQLNLSILPGERIAMVGSTGSGKTTLTDLLLGLIKPTFGQILINGLDLHATPGLLQAWQQQVAHVPQHIFLSDGSFAENIAFGVPVEDINIATVIKSSQGAHISEVIQSNPMGYEAKVGERGVRLSGGQRQRIGIARALYKQASLMVFDEATSALDNKTESSVMEAIESLDRNLTMVFIAHRLTTVKSCDRIVMLEHGCIVGFGSYSEMIEQNSSFQELAQHN